MAVFALTSMTPEKSQLIWKKIAIIIPFLMIIRICQDPFPELSPTWLSLPCPIWVHSNPMPLCSTGCTDCPQPCPTPPMGLPHHISGCGKTPVRKEVPITEASGAGLSMWHPVTIMQPCTTQAPCQQATSSVDLGPEVPTLVPSHLLPYIGWHFFICSVVVVPVPSINSSPSIQLYAPLCPVKKCEHLGPFPLEATQSLLKWLM